MTGSTLERTPPVLRLPDLEDEKQPGARFVKRAVSTTLYVLFGILGTAAAISFLVKIDVTVKAPGTLEPVRVWPVRGQEAGSISEVLVRTGQEVKRGQPVLRLDDLQLGTTLAQLEAQYRAGEINRERSASAAPVERRQQGDRLAQADARVVTARAALRQRMVENSLGSDPDSLLRVYRPGQHVAIDLAVGELRAAEADRRLAAGQQDVLALERFDRAKNETDLQQLAAQIRAARARLARLTLTAPIDGVVLTEQIERLPGAFVREGELLVEIADLAQWRVTLYVRERDVHKVEVGDSVKVEVQAFNSAEHDLLAGKVVHVADEPASAQGAGAGAAASAGAQGVPAPGGTGVYRVVAQLDREELARVGMDKFRRGYTVQGQVITKSGRIATLLWQYMNDKVRGRV